MYLNVFAKGAKPVDLTGTQEFESLLESARDLGVSYSLPVRMESRNLLLNGLRFNLLDWGSVTNPPLILLHGGNQSAHSWDLVSLHLAERFRVIALDQRGHGDSEWPRDCDSHFRSMADDVAALIDDMALQSPLIMGHSMGGLVVLELLARGYRMVRRAVLVDVAPQLSIEGSKLIGGFVRSLGEYDSIDDFVERVRQHDPYRPVSHIERTARYNLLCRIDGKYVTKHDTRRRYIDGVRVAVRADWPQPVDPGSIDIPILLVRGANSPVLTQDLAEQFVDRLSAGQLTVVDHSGHNVHSQNTVGFLNAVVPFLILTGIDGTSGKIAQN